LRRTCTVCVGLGLLALAACQAAETPPAGEEPTASEKDATPPGYTIRLDDETSDPGDFQLTEADGRIAIRTGPAGIAYHPNDEVLRGDFFVEATFTQYDAPLGYREAYGIFVGGHDLGSPELEYTYLLVRPTGDYLIKRRVGETTETLVDWSPHPAVRRVLREGDEPENTLAIMVLDGEIRFVVNDEILFAMPTSEARPYGVAGLRANHRLNIRVTDWALGDITRP
jgi:hypothetical protein